MDRTAEFQAERPRLLGLATRVLADHGEAEDVVQQAWLRLHGADTDIESLPAWLTTVTTRLCLDRLRTRTRIELGVPDLEVYAGVEDTGAGRDPGRRGGSGRLGRRRPLGGARPAHPG